MILGEVYIVDGMFDLFIYYIPWIYFVQAWDNCMVK